MTNGLRARGTTASGGLGALARAGGALASARAAHKSTEPLPKPHTEPLAFVSVAF